ncbi:MAG: hypothetical protein ACO1N5_07860 [Noviherbaspirillum sp.]
MRTEFLFSEIYAHPPSFMGQYADLKATLVVRDSECFLVPNLRSLDAFARVEVFSPGLEAKLDARVGPRMGKPENYFDNVIIGGFLQSGSTQRCLYSLSRLTKLVLFRDKRDYQII